MDPEETQLEETTSPESSPETKTTEDTPSSEEKKQADDIKRLPFNEDPAVQEYIERQVNKRLEDFDQKFEQRFQTVNQPQSVQIPEWFGGDEKQWKAYQADQDRIIQQAEERAVKRVTERQTAQQRAVEEANQWFEDSVGSLEREHGVTIDRDQLLQTVMKEELIDSKGRWNYRAGFKVLQAQEADKTTKDDKLNDRRRLAGATTSDNAKGEKEARTFKTSEDFLHERPW